LGTSSALAIPNRAYHSLSLLQALILAVKVRRLGMPVVVPLPDTCIAQDSLVGGIMATGNRRSCTLVLQSSWEQASRFGIPQSAPGLLWTWPTSRWQEWQSDVPLDQREALAVLASSGDPRRSSILADVAAFLEDLGFQLVMSDHSLPWDEYVSLCKRSSVVVTTNWMQPAWKRQPLFGKLIPETTVTGRTWEAFATNSVLICNRADALTEMGFHPNIHYLDLDMLRADRPRLSSLLTLSGVEIANTGHKQMGDMVHQQ